MLIAVYSTTFLIHIANIFTILASAIHNLNLSCRDFDSCLLHRTFAAGLPDSS
jgi:hypothetical protein